MFHAMVNHPHLLHSRFTPAKQTNQCNNSYLFPQPNIISPPRSVNNSPNSIIFGISIRLHDCTHMVPMVANRKKIDKDCLSFSSRHPIILSKKMSASHSCCINCLTWTWKRVKLYVRIHK
eukprot:PhF_6_TR14942/c0_g1_i3/m.23431